MLHEVAHFEEDARINQEGLLPIDLYSRALDYLVIACVDIAFISNDQVLLGKRNTYPKKGWWLIGGRMMAGESPTKAAKRKTYQEAGLDLDLSHFTYINAYSTCFSQRSQEPQNNGLHSVNLTYLVNISDHEKQQIKLIKTEYEDLKWIKLDQVTDLLDLSNEMDIALLRIVEDIKKL